jgi:hypothetical protein
VLVEQVAAFLDAFGVDALADVVPEGVDEFRLALVKFQYPFDGPGQVEALSRVDWAMPRLARLPA